MMTEFSFWWTITFKKNESKIVNVIQNFQWVCCVSRNWLVTEPSCGLEQCVALFYRPSSSAGQKEHNLFKWTDYNCNSKNNFICKYSDGRLLLMLILAVTFRYLIGNKSETSIFSVNILYKRTSNVNCATSCMCLEKHPVPTPAGNITTLTGKQILKLYWCICYFLLTQ